jgi:RimJ/RimL family protein N-acetyltransferase
VSIVLGQDAAVAGWVAARIPHVTGFKDMAAIGIERAGELVGGVVYHEYRGNDIQMSTAADSRRWLTEGVLRALFVYPFVTLGCERVSAFTPKGSTSTRRFLERLGFVEEGNMRRGFVGDDCILYGMLKEECKWIKGFNHG